MKLFNLFSLQLFAGEGGTGAASSSGEGGENAGESAVDAEQQRLLELGVPKDKIRKRKTASARPQFTAAAVQSVQENSPSESAVSNEGTDGSEANSENAEAPPKKTWEEIMADEDYNREMQKTVAARVGNLKSENAELKKTADRLKGFEPILKGLAESYGLDGENIDATALAMSLASDGTLKGKPSQESGNLPNSSVASLANEMQDIKNTEAQKNDALQRQKFAEHVSKLEAQGNELKKVFPNFNLKEELKNPAFMRMTSPNVGLSVEDAYYAVHRKEIEEAAIKKATEETAKKLSNSIAANALRPFEAGVSSQAPSVTKFDYSKLTREQQKAFVSDIKSRLARGERILPNEK